MYKKVFINEIGNKITVKVKKHNGVGVNYKTKIPKKYKGVSLILIGPTSMSENQITLEEAREMHKALGAFLRDM